MKRKILGITINFRVHWNEQKSKCVLLLHGWGGNLNSFRDIENNLIEKNYSVITLDFPSFGGSEVPPENFTLNDYKNVCTEILKTLEIKKVSLICHSFGGRVGILLASEPNNMVEKLVLIASAGIKPKFSLINYIKQKKYKRLKNKVNSGKSKIDLSKYGSADYKALPENMKKVFVRIVNTDLTENLSKIDVPTLLLWAKDDKSTPYYMAKKMHKLIKNNGLVTLKDGGHFCYLKYSKDCSIIIDNFFKAEM